jgi:hypothetical protein
VVTTRNGRVAFTAPAPTERKNTCYKWATRAQVDEFTAEAAPKEEAASA